MVRQGRKEMMVRQGREGDDGVAGEGDDGEAGEGRR